MPSFLNDLSLRRRSKASVNADSEAASEQSTNDGTNSATKRNKISRSSSTLSSLFDKATPPTPLSMSSTNLSYNANGSDGTSATPPPIPPNRPRLASTNGKRYSLVNGTSNEETSPRTSPTSSPWAPRVLSISDGSWCHQKVLLIFGTCADPQQPLDGSIYITHNQDSFPAQTWPVNDSHFKALVYLTPGPNRLRLDFTSPRLQQGTSVHTSWLNINFLPLINSPPIQLCILLGRDSPGTYDAVPERVAKEGNDLQVAIRKFRMQAYLWQAFTAEQMNRNSLGRRCYRYEEEWQPGTLSYRDIETKQMRNEAKIHVIRLDKTKAEIQDLDLAQQYSGAKRNGDLFGIAMDAVRDYFKPTSGQPQYVSCLYLDAHWDREVGTIRGHAALGGGDDNVKLAIFGSQALQSYPTCLEEVVPAFTDCTRTDTNYVANDCGESGSNWEAANIGIGAHLHETGHLLGCPHQESGVMMRDYVTLNRTFTTREPYSTRTKQPGQRLVLPSDECAWHRLDTLRFRYHPCFKLPSDSPVSDPAVRVWTVDNGTMLVTAAAGISWIEMFPEGDNECHHWLEYSDHQPNAPTAPRQIMLTEQTLRDRLPEDKRRKKIKITIFSCSGDYHDINDVSDWLNSQRSLRLPDGRPGFKSSKLGSSAMDGSQPQEVIFGTAWRSKEPMRSVRVYHGGALDGMEFCYEGGRSELFGKRGGKEGGDEFLLDIRRGETILGFVVRAGFHIDGVQILTSTGRRSDWYGSTGGSAHTLIPPRGYSIAGIYGSCGAWLDGFGLIITR